MLGLAVVAAAIGGEVVSLDVDEVSALSDPVIALVSLAGIHTNQSLGQYVFTR